jgi:lysophospholipase L1-like esterase/photosystem II stability/assembly factor-like uncharacterized protein
MWLSLAPAFSAEIVTWEHILLGPGGGWNMIKIDPQNDDIVYVSSDMGNWAKSMDGGKTWIDLTPAQLEATGRGGLMDYGLLIDPKDTNTLYLASNGVYRSLDGGKSWKLISDAFYGGAAFACRMAMDPADSKVMYLGHCDGNLIKTENAGETWVKLSGTGWGQFRKGGADLINILVGHDHAVYACMFGKGIFKSIDNGQTWTTNNVGLPYLEIGSFQAAVEKNRTVLYALLIAKQSKGNLEGGLYRSMNGAKSWEQVKVLDEEKYKVRCPPRWCQMAVSPNDPNFIYLTAKEVLEEWGTDGTYRSSDGGKTWEFLPGEYEENFLGFPFVMFPYLAAFTVSPLNPRKLYLANQSIVLRSDDGGKSWQKLSQLDVGNGYYRSTGLEDICVLWAADDPQDRNRLYLGLRDDFFVKSEDRGRTFKGGRGLRGVIEYNSAGCVVVDPASPNKVWIGTGEVGKGEVARSTNYADHWQSTAFNAGSGLPRDGAVWSLVLDPKSPVNNRTLYASYLPCGVDKSRYGVYKSMDDGITWKPVNNGLSPNLGTQVVCTWLALSKDSVLYALLNGVEAPPHPYLEVANSMIYQSRDAGNTWEKMADFSSGVENFSVDPQNPAVIYTAARAGGLLKSTDRGKTWKNIFSKPDTSVNWVAMDNFDSNLVYISIQGYEACRSYIDDKLYGVWISTNAGNTWESANRGFGHKKARIFPSSYRKGVFYAATWGNAVFKGYVNGVAAPEEPVKPSLSSTGIQKAPPAVSTQGDIMKMIKTNSITAAMIDKPVNIDGELDEEAWAKAPAVTGFYDIRSQTLAEKQTTVKALYDGESLYLGIICAEPNVKNIIAPQRKHDNGAVCNDDAVEVFVARGEKGKVFQFIVNGTGSRWDAAYDYMRCDAGWNPQPDWKAAAKKGKSEWTVEMAIPLKAVTVPGSTDEPWRIKICRDDQQSLAFSSWPASLKNGFLAPPAQFAPVILGAAATDFKMARKQTIMVVAFGDSITAATQQAPDDRWPEILGRALQDSFPECIIKVINAGVGGNTSREGLRRMEQDVLKHAPDFVLVEFGGNDNTSEPARHVSFEEFTNNLAQIRKNVTERNNGRLIMLTFPPVVDEWRPAGGEDAAVELYRNLARQFAQEHGLPLADIDKVLRKKMSQDGYHKAEYILRDGVHLTAQGNKVVADAVMGILSAEIGKLLNQRASTN